jgi:bifunctional non-homologous end joining protein LigD
VAPHPEADRLAAYRAKRSAERTPEPFGSAAARPRLFVVQEHRARRRHFDLRLEWQGVMWSWAVPKGPSLDPAQKRLAVRVEDHPLDYADFEGSIPEGNYGAGAVIVWDKGRWVPVEDPAAGIEKGKLLFDLYGYKLRGRYTLVRTGGSRRKRDAPESKEWLLIKKPDAFASATAELPPQSIHSGRTVDDVAANASPEAALLRDAARAGAAKHRVAASRARPMLAEAWDEPFSAKGWFFEVKYDGYRVIAAREEGRARLFYRSGREATALFPELTAALAALPVSHAVLDGELVVHGAAGRPSFQLLQGRAHATPREAARASVETPAALALFDLLGIGDLDLRPLPLRARRELLARLAPPVGPLQLAPHWEERGRAVFAEIEKLGFEGMVAKRADAPYRAGRSPAWRKIRIQKTGDFAVVGWSAGRGARSGFGALHVAARDSEGLRYVGRVGSGFTEKQLLAIRRALEADERKTPPCHGSLPSARGAHWVKPRLVVEVRYVEWTADGSLRQPVFLRLRDDKSVEDVEELREALVAGAGASLMGSRRSPSARYAGSAPGDSVAAGGEEREALALTNLDKVFWPGEGYTKGDLLEYYRAIAPWLLPYLKDRPLVLTRFPDGIEGKSFFQKDAPSWAPEWLRTERLWSEHGGRDIHYFVCDDVDSLLYVVNMGAIPLHVWSSRVASLARPDWCILDIDPKGAPLAGAVAIARAIHALAEEIALPTFVKTSGSEGIHVLVPLGGRMSFEQSRRLAELVASVVVGELPDVATLERMPKKRGGRVYLDTLQNGHGKLLAAPFSARPLPGAPVSMPLRWSEVNARLDPRRFTIRNAVARMKRLGEDPLRGVLDTAPDLGAALSRLIARVRNRAS